MGSMLPEKNLPDMTLMIKAGAKTRVRVVSDAKLITLFRHTYKEGKFFSKMLCTRYGEGEEGCPYCNYNLAPGEVEKPNRDRKYPVAGEMVKWVWVYELNAPKLLVGNEVWKNIDTQHVELEGAGEAKGIYGHDITIISKDDGRITYQIAVLPASPFTITVDPATIPDIETYRAFLKKNWERVPAMTSPTTSASTTTEVKETSTTAQSQPAGGKLKHSQEVADKLNAALRKHGFDAETLSTSMTRVNPDKKKVNEFSNEEVEKLIIEYGILTSQGT